MRPLGQHRDAEPIDTYAESALPSPEDFWKKHVNGFRPAYFPGLGQSHPAFKKWSDDYLLKEFGHFDVKTEPKQEERLSDHCSRKRGGVWMDGRGIKPDWVVPCPKVITT